MARFELVAGAAETGKRLDSVLARALPQCSRETLKKAILAGCCHVDGIALLRPDVKVKTGQHLAVDMPEQHNMLMAEEGEVSIVWQDASLVLCNKPAGLTVHPCPSCPEHTLVQRLLGRFPQLSRLEGLRPGIVHRLDKDTSGLLLVALTETARLTLSGAFADRKVRKEYLALVSGLAPAQGECRESIGRHPTAKIKMAVLEESRGGKAAHTEWRRLWASPDASVSLLAVRIHTGRTHQIRVHMAHVGYPLLGDALYAPAAVRTRASRQMLHAWRLGFNHPDSQEALFFQCPPPADMAAAALATCRRMQRVVITGNPGSGKSSIAAALQKQGLPLFSADTTVARLYAPKGEAAQWIAGRWGGDLLKADGSVAKDALLAAMQTNSTIRRELEDMVHTLVRTAVEDFWQKQEAAGHAVAVAEIPLYFECGWQQVFDPKPVIVGVHCPQALRHERLAHTRGWSMEKAAALEAWQWPETRKEAACQIVVDNSGLPEKIPELTESLLATLQDMARTVAEAHAQTLTACWDEPYPVE